MLPIRFTRTRINWAKLQEVFNVCQAKIMFFPKLKLYSSWKTNLEAVVVFDHGIRVEMGEYVLNQII